MFYYLIRKLLFLIEPEKAHFLTLKYLNIKNIQLFNFFFIKLEYHQKKLNAWV
ncbi:MAG: dihydroorotate dehydrogenase [Buchnera aphidicola (Microlophium carnosum)]|uniref:Dihydroorotate dehydrogenase n=1 Tax=Buchnera aphidicola (Microlophium carnosum) TaxID=2708354 RepID=A0A6G9JTB5_9GAMM|nr:MAG: dihydroorotate dehydrogenase [Buchnera aphidicola (Microlophium carnosum)]